MNNIINIINITCILKENAHGMRIERKLWQRLSRLLCQCRITPLGVVVSTRLGYQQFLLCVLNHFHILRALLFQFRRCLCKGREGACSVQQLAIL
jgi:hypothetical protein